MGEREIDGLLARLEAAGRRLEGSRARVEAGAPWPTGSQARGEAEERWGPTEVLAHAAEMLPFWLGEMERVLAAPAGGQPPHFGRTPSDQVRTLTVARDATLPPRELFARIAAAIERYGRRLPELTDAEAARSGRHPTRGGLTVVELIERFAVGHLEEHAVQLEEVAVGGRGA